MPDTPTVPSPQTDWRRIHAFGLPAGSIRAVMAILIFATLWAHLLLRPDLEVPDSLRDLLFIILGHYFAVRSRTEPGEAPGPPPLYLPKGTVRLLIMGGFVAVAFALFRQGRIASPGKNPGVVTLLLVFGFLLGVVLQKFASWWNGRGKVLPRWFEDTRALISLLATVFLAVLICDQLRPFLPATFAEIQRQAHFEIGRYGPEHVLAAIVGFYFGSRS
ncbi:hypothetical protein [Singulisphaera sp. PoT]|uniref:hypothetical protein n=1 Tax=Singulisphaera sp. PoT TaxID=3411797 RepID=UPI003BF5643B